MEYYDSQTRSQKSLLDSFVRKQLIQSSIEKNSNSIQKLSEFLKESFLQLLEIVEQYIKSTLFLKKIEKTNLLESLKKVELIMGELENLITTKNNESCQNEENLQISNFLQTIKNQYHEISSNFNLSKGLMELNLDLISFEDLDPIFFQNQKDIVMNQQTPFLNIQFKRRTLKLAQLKFLN